MEEWMIDPGGGRGEELTPAERAASLDALFKEWELEDAADDRPLEVKLAEIEEFMRAIDAERPHRPLFKQYYER
jgi:hypothetical protein